jgi:hypothetical protein
MNIVGKRLRMLELTEMLFDSECEFDESVDKNMLITYKGDRHKVKVNANNYILIDNKNPANVIFNSARELMKFITHG